MKCIIFDCDGVLVESAIFHSNSTKASAIAGISDLLAKLEKNHEKTCVASSGTLHEINKSLTDTDLIQYFPAKNIFSIQHVKKGKPAPDIFLYAAEKMGCDPKDCIVIEDSLAGIEAAIAANMCVIGFLGGSHTHYDGYKLKMCAYGIPIAQDTTELYKIIAKKI
jgi:HAD superfamily hydrolase (TIGR01509 family)